MNRLIPISAEARMKLPMPTGDYDADCAAIAAALTPDMIPPTPEGFEMAEWQINPPDEVYVLFCRSPARTSAYQPTDSK